MVRLAEHPHAESTTAAPVAARRSPTATADWRMALPCLAGARVTLRELREEDAAALFVALNTEQVTRFLSPPPATIGGFEAFIRWTHRQRAAGQYVCFAIVPHGSDTPVGMFQVRALDSSFGTAEWGFALASEFWGTGIFVDGARLVVDFTFEVLRAHRLEARAAVKNGRGNGALRKLGAVQEGVLRRSLLCNGEYLDQTLWTIVDDEWIGQPRARGERVIFH
jgi:RimJ/RimL family protein N-acetyltransferase